LGHVEMPGDRLENFPITFFAIVMGMLGLTLAVQAAENAFGSGPAASLTCLAISVVIFLSVSGLYGLKFFMHRTAVIEEWHHPVKIAFFPTVSISVLLIAVAAVPYSLRLASVLWIVGAALQIVLTLSVIASWIGQSRFSRRISGRPGSSPPLAMSQRLWPGPRSASWNCRGCSFPPVWSSGSFS